MTTIALLGAGGKMGLRLSANLAGSPYEVRHVEISERGKAALAECGIEAVALEKALYGADAVVLALPDNRIGPVMHDLEPLLSAGTMVIMLDVAAAYAGVLPPGPGLTYFITHPCHPPIFSDEVTPRRSATSSGANTPSSTLFAASLKVLRSSTRSESRSRGKSTSP